MSRLLLFDIDGTLTRDSHAFDGLFARTLEQELGLRMHQRWGEYPHSTDSGILDHVVRSARGRPPTEAEIARVKERYHQCLREHCHLAASRAGAAACLNSLACDSRFDLGIVTGNWLGAAEIKLAAAGIDAASLRLFSADVSFARAEILLAAITHGGCEPEASVYFGDAPWDADAARRLRVPFVAVGPDGSRFREFEPPVRVEDFLDIAAVKGAARSAAVPQRLAPHRG